MPGIPYLAKAVGDAWLGTWLDAVERELQRFERRVRLYVLVQRITPPPQPGNSRRGLRRAFLWLSPKVRRSDVEQILCTMRRIHQRGEATVYLP